MIQRQRLRSLGELADLLRDDLPMEGSRLRWLRAHQADVLELARRWSSGRTAMLLDIPTAALDQWVEAVTQGKVITEQAFIREEAPAAPAPPSEGSQNSIAAQVGAPDNSTRPSRLQPEPAPQPARPADAAPPQAAAPPSSPAEAEPAAELPAAPKRRGRPRGSVNRGNVIQDNQVLEFLRQYRQAHGVSPVFSEIMASCGIRSTSTVAYCLQRLEEKGFLKRSAGRARTIVLLDGNGAQGSSPSPEREKTEDAALRQPYEKVGAEAVAENNRARKVLGHGTFASAHEGYAMMLEEMDELWQEVKGHRSPRNLRAMRKEAVQVAAMAIAFAVEVCDA